MTLDYDERYFHGKPQNSFHVAVNIPDVVVFPRLDGISYFSPFLVIICHLFIILSLALQAIWSFVFFFKYHAVFSASVINYNAFVIHEVNC